MLKVFLSQLGLDGIALAVLALFLLFFFCGVLMIFSQQRKKSYEQIATLPLLEEDLCPIKKEMN